MTPTRPFASNEFQELQSNTNDPKIRAQALKLASTLTNHVGIADAMSILTDALHETFMAILHVESPMPELNIATIHMLIDSLKERVKEHEPCAIHRTQTLRGETEGEDVKPTVN